MKHAPQAQRGRSPRAVGLASQPGAPPFVVAVISVEVLCLAVILGGCGGGTSAPGVGIQGVSQAAPPLSEYNAQGDYSPYFATGDLQRPRYFHEVILTEKGNPVVAGGSDERGFSGIDTVEIFDQATFEKDAPRPPSLAGIWIDTNFEGDAMTFENGARMHFTIDRLANGKLLFMGGASDLVRGTVTDAAEVFDPETRTFETLDEKTVKARFRHVSVTLNDGSLLFIGGQIQTTVTIINENIEPGNPGRESQEVRYITTNLSEMYVPREDTFVTLTLPDSTRESKLNTPRGRADHAVTRLAGPDAALATSDDVLLVGGGFQGLSGQFAPQFKFPFTVARGSADGLTVLEFYDPITRVFTQVSSVSLDDARMNRPYIINLGTHNDFTIDGVKGLGNLVLVTGGNVDAFCPTTVLQDILLMATFTGFGPAQGLQFFRITDDTFLSHFQGGEYPPPPPLIDPRANVVARCATNPIPMPRGLLGIGNVDDIQTWVVSTGGVDIFPTPGGCAFNYDSPTMLAGCVFDPFFNLASTLLGLSPRNLSSQRSQTNPLGIVGHWLTLDGAIPTVDLSVFGNTSPNRWGKRVTRQRAWGRNAPVAGQDGIINTPDDRLLLTGGGKDYGDPASVGGEPATPSSELLLLPGSNTKTPSP